MRVFPLSASLLAAAVLIVAPATAAADGKRDLEDAIAFYENLDTERAMARLKSALSSGDLGLEDRGRAYLYLGMVQFEIGQRQDAAASMGSAFGLDPTLSIPEGTSPKTIEALEAARKKAKSSPPPVAEPPKKADPPPPPKEKPEL